MDDISYEVALVFSFQELIDEVPKELATRHANEIEEIGLVFFEELQPLFGSIGVERSVSGIQSILRQEAAYLPADMAYYSEALYEKIKETSFVKEAVLLRKLESGGCYFRRNVVTDYISCESASDGKLLYRQLKSSL